MNSKKKQQNIDLINAAALQSHYQQKIGLDLRIPTFNYNSYQHRLTKQNQFTKLAKNLLNSNNINDLRQQGKELLNHKYAPNSYNSGLEESEQKVKPTKHYLSYQQKQRKRWEKELNENICVAKNTEEIKIDQKLKKYYQKLTLAQRLGLVEQPDKPLDNEQWKEIETKCQKRNDEESVCAICLSEFKSEDQVILSCSHVFHKNCIQSFEKFAQTKQCPICRKQQYEKKQYIEGNKQYLHRCIIKIQKIIRGYIQRTKFMKYLDLNKPQSYLLKRELLNWKLINYSRKVNKEQNKQNEKTSKLLNEVDKNFNQANNQLNSQLDKIYENIDSNAIRIAQFGDQFNVPIKNKANIPEEFKIKKDQWDELKQKALERCDDCAICYCSLQNSKSLTLLSCSHLFHTNCLNAFERYSLSDVKQCPICRTANYEKLTFILQTPTQELTQQQCSHTNHTKAIEKKVLQPKNTIKKSTEQFQLKSLNKQQNFKTNPKKKQKASIKSLGFDQFIFNKPSRQIELPKLPQK